MMDKNKNIEIKYIIYQTTLAMSSVAEHSMYYIHYYSWYQYLVTAWQLRAIADEC